MRALVYSVAFNGDHRIFRPIQFFMEILLRILIRQEDVKQRWMKKQTELQMQGEYKWC